MAKDMKRNVADNFFAGASDEFKKTNTNTNNTHTQQTNTNNKFDICKTVVETKSKRVNLVLQPSLYKKAQAIADANGVSFNEMITQILNQVVENNEK